MLEYNEIKPRKVIVYEGAPYEVLTSHVFRKQQRKPVNAVKMKNLLTGKVVENSFHQSEKAEEAEVEKRKIKYLYESKGEYWFCEENDPGKRFKLETEQVGTQINYVKQNSLVDLVSFQGTIIGIEVPIKVELKVIEAAPAVKGNTVQGGVKQVKLETGFTVNVPMFINEGDILRLNTETGEYTERVN
ncbi:MAG TPA: elongation factor P [Candidatus Paceibacterota bacterium]|nr:elongation factor P [Candidatus Paceibacterota bacterium]